LIFSLLSSLSFSSSESCKIICKYCIGSLQITNHRHSHTEKHWETFYLTISYM
jgi:L-lysine 2,3-aminomutase